MRGTLRHPQNPTKKGRFGINTEPPFSCSNQHAEEVCKCAQLHRAKGSRDEVPCGVQRQRLWRGLGAAPLGLPPNQHAEEVCKCAQLNRAKGSRDEVPCGVQRQRLWRGLGAAPLGLPPNQHAEEVCKCAQLNRAKGSRDEVPCGVQRQRLWWGLGAKPLGSPFTPKSSQSPLFPRPSAAHAFAPFPRFGESAQGGLRR